MAGCVIKPERVFIAGVVFSCLAAASLSAASIHDAVRRHDTAALRILLNEDPSQVNSSAENDATPIHVAAALDDADVVELLIAAGANIDAKTANGATPLHWAAMVNAGNSAEVLIRKGADVRATTSEGLTALQVASMKGSAKVADLLKSAEAGVQAGILADRRFVEGRQALEKGEAQQAFDIFMELLREYPESTDVNFALGEAAYAAGKYSHAALAFERIVASHPENHRARLELARTYFSAKQFEPARREFETVLARQPPEAVRKNINDFLDEIRKQEKRFWISARVDAGVFYDDNANVGPDSEVLNIDPNAFGLLTWTLGEESLPVKSWGALLSATASTCYDIGRKGGWMLACDGIAYHSWLEKHAAEEETFFLSVNPGLCRTGEKSVVRVPVKALHIEHGGEPLVNVCGVAPSVFLPLGQGAAWNCTLEATAEYRDYATLDDRDGSYFAAGGRIRRSFGTYLYHLYGGAAIFYEKTAADIYENLGAEAVAGGEVRLPWKMAGYAQAKYRTASYAERETLAPEKRRDSQYQFTAGLRKALAKRCGMDLSCQHTKNDSTFDLYEYRRNVVTLSMSCFF